MIDTASARLEMEAVRQITGGCFCCRSGELMLAIRELEQESRPDVFLAEPVGSCTDLMATVLLPLEQVYEAGFRRAPMSVLLDAKRAWRHCFGRERAGTGFSKDVRYIYLKQMEEAEILVINKKDLLTPAQAGKLMDRLERDFPGKRVLPVSAETGEGLEEWFGLLMATESRPEKILEIDYARYGEGEAQLGWYNARLTMPSGKVTLEADKFLLELAEGIQRKLEEAEVEIAHFKMSLERQGESGGGLSVVNVVRNGDRPVVSRKMEGPMVAGELLINLRAEGAPAVLERIVRHALRGLPFRFERKAAFRPGMPKPVHRAVSVG